ncbi:hypothetical protein H4582DRAFT_1819055 [Lactarius indigo]|nr:hypothetical protein H4582DRAFT_1819055 [Lactarius indigo]
MIHRIVAHQATSNTTGPGEDSVTADTITRNWPATPIQSATKALEATSVSFLVTHETPTSNMSIPCYRPYTISPTKSRYLHLMEREPETEAESQLRDALKESEARDHRRKCAMMEMQANVVLQSLWSSKLKSHLEENEAKAKGKKSNRVLSDGMPHLFTGDAFAAAVEKDEMERQKKAQEKEGKRCRRAQHTEALAEWKKLEAARKERNEAKRLGYRTAVKAWEAERDLAKNEHRRPQWNKPKFEGYEKALPRPKLAEENMEEEEEEEEDGGIPMYNEDDDE